MTEQLHRENNVFHLKFLFLKLHSVSFCSDNACDFVIVGHGNKSCRQMLLYFAFIEMSTADILTCVNRGKDSSRTLAVSLTRSLMALCCSSASVALRQNSSP